MFKSPVSVLYLPEDCFEGGQQLLERAMTYYDAITDERRVPSNAGAMLKVIYDVAIYIGEVQNGGHGQHLDNAEPTRAEICAIRDAFQASGAGQFASIVERYSDQASSRIDAGFVPDGPDYYELLRPLDLEYFSAEAQKPPDAYFADYLAGQSWVKRMPSNLFEAGISALRKQALIERRRNASGSVKDLAAMIDWFISPDPDRPWWKA